MTETMADYFRTVDARYGRMTVFSNDQGAITQSLTKYGEWAEGELRFLRSTIPDGACVLDIGAYIGTHALAFSRFVGPSGRVICIEAQPSTFNLLKTNVEANDLTNVQLVHAVASCEQTDALIEAIAINRPDSFGSASLLQLFSRSGLACDNVVPSVSRPRVQVTTIDALALPRCDLIKIDAEGMEELVLRGATLTLQRCKPIVYAECNSLEAGLKTFSVLGGAGYCVKAHLVEAFNPDNFNFQSENIFDAAREVALVGIIESGKMEQYQLRAGELLLDIETADDLALALMNKPQYAQEVLYPGAAARTGGSRCLDAAEAARLDVDKVRNEINRLRSRTEVELRRGYRETAAAQDELRRAEQAMKAKIDACMREVAILRREAGKLQPSPALAHASHLSTITKPASILARWLSRIKRPGA